MLIVSNTAMKWPAGRTPSVRAAGAVRRFSANANVRRSEGSSLVSAMGHAFAGGTVEALLEHVVAYSLVPRHGSVPQRRLSKLATVLAHSASDQSLTVRKRLDKLRSNGSLMMPDDEPSKSTTDGSTKEAAIPLNAGEELSSSPMAPRSEPGNVAEQKATSKLAALDSFRNSQVIS